MEALKGAYVKACANREDFDQPARPRSLIRVFFFSFTVYEFLVIYTVLKCKILGPVVQSIVSLTSS